LCIFFNSFLWIRQFFGKDPSLPDFHAFYLFVCTKIFFVPGFKPQIFERNKAIRETDSRIRTAKINRDNAT
jgi:hypothetical protein